MSKIQLCIKCYDSFCISTLESISFYNMVDDIMPTFPKLWNPLFVITNIEGAEISI